MTSLSEGVLYVATGEEYVEEAMESVDRIDSEYGSIPITLITDLDVCPESVDTVLSIDDPHYSSHDKVENLLRTPYERTIYLDIDTYVVNKKALDDLFALLDQFDLAVAHDHFRRGDTMTTPDGMDELDVPIPDSFSWFNTGALVFS